MKDGSKNETCQLNDGIPGYDKTIDVDAPYPVIPKKLPLENMTCSCSDPSFCEIYE